MGERFPEEKRESQKEETGIYNGGRERGEKDAEREIPFCEALCDKAREMTGQRALAKADQDGDNGVKAEEEEAPGVRAGSDGDADQDSEEEAEQRTAQGAVEDGSDDDGDQCQRDAEAPHPDAPREELEDQDERREDRGADELRHGNNFFFCFHDVLLLLSKIGIAH